MVNAYIERLQNKIPEKLKSDFFRNLVPGIHEYEIMKQVPSHMSKKRCVALGTGIAFARVFGLVAPFVTGEVLTFSAYSIPTVFYEGNAFVEKINGPNKQKKIEDYCQ